MKLSNLSNSSKGEDSAHWDGSRVFVSLSPPNEVLRISNSCVSLSWYISWFVTHGNTATHGDTTAALACYDAEQVCYGGGGADGAREPGSPLGAPSLLGCCFFVSFIVKCSGFFLVESSVVAKYL